MLKIRMFMALSTIVLLFSVNTYAQFSRQQAIDTVINHIVAADTGNINVYIANQNFALGQPILTYTGDSIVCMYSNNFVFFVDDNPISNCQPECRYIIISSETGNYTMVYQNLFPKKLETDYELLSGFQPHAPNTLNNNTEIILPTPTPNANLHAVLIAGKIASEIQGIRYSNDMALVYNTLLEKGYSKENIIVHFGHGDGTAPYGDDFDGLPVSDDIDYPAYKEDIEATFSYLSSTLDANDLLFIYVTDHGGISWLDNWHQYIELAHAPYNDSVLWDYQFAGYLSNIACSQVVVVMQQCYSGGFLNELQNIPMMNFELSIYTAGHTGEIQGLSGETWSEEWLTSGYYCEFTFYWCAAVRGVYPIVDRPWEPLCITGTRDFKRSDTLIWHTDDYIPDENGDFQISMNEASNYANFMNTWNIDGQNYHPYLSDRFETPMYDSDYEEIQTLVGYAGQFNSITLNTNSSTILIGGKLETNGDIVISNDKVLYFSNESAGTISNSLITDNSVQFLATSANNQIVVNNLLQLGQNNLFTSEGPDWNVYLNGAGMQTVIDDATFEKCKLHNYGSSLTISNSTFDDCVQLSSHSGNVDISDCDFSATWLNLEDLSANQYSADVTGCNFTNGSAIVAIDIWDYDNFNVVSNTIDGFICGVQVYQSGFGQRGNQLIKENVIENCTVAGILAYNSYCDIYSNTIRNNYSGVRLLGSGDVMLGTPDMIITGTTIQEISDNTSYEVYASINMFPQYFKYNIIVDDDNAGNPNDPLVYCNFGASDENNKLDVKYNCWGSNFNYAADLYPSNMYWYLPYWCPPESEGESEESDIMLQSGLDYFEDGNYENAKSVFESVIDQYPETSAAKAAMKELLRTEKYLGEDYQTLKTYYLNNDTIVSDATLEILGDRLANDCDVKMENWENAITWYENRIENPPTFEDSIFAIIDLGYTYLLMENSGLKSAFKGSLTQHIPVSQERFIENRDYLLSLLPGELKNSANNQMNGVNEHQAEIMQNVPNPFASTTQIAFKLNNVSDIKISITDYTGKSLKTINVGVKETGTHSITFSAQNFNPGIYFYTLITNGIPTETRKMIILK